MPRNALLPSILFLVSLGTLPVNADKLDAKPFEKSSDYEFYLFAPDRRVEVETYLVRIGELDQTIEAQNKEVTGIENELKQASSGATKRKKTLQWSAIEKVTGYSVKLYNANKELIATHAPTDSTITLELDEGSYYFQVAAVTKFKTGTFSQMSQFRVSKGRHSASELKLEDQIEIIRERIKISERLRADYIVAIQKLAVSNTNSAVPVAEVTASKDASYFVALDKKAAPQKFSSLGLIPGRDGKVTNEASLGGTTSGTFLWGAGLVGGIQDTAGSSANQTYFRTNFGVEGFLRYDRVFLKFLRPQLKLQSEYSPSRTAIFDSMLHTSLYLGMYYPLKMTEKFMLVGSLGTGINNFLVFATAGSSSIIQWGFMPAVEFQYALYQNLGIYMGVALNLTYDPSGAWLKFVPINLGVTRRF